MKDNIFTAIIIILIIMALVLGVISYIYSAPLLYIIWEMR